MSADIIRIKLTLEQAAMLAPLLEQHRQTTGTCGLLAAITQSYRSESDGVTLELQILPLNRLKAAAINKAARNLNRGH